MSDLDVTLGITELDAHVFDIEVDIPAPLDVSLEVETAPPLEIGIEVRFPSGDGSSYPDYEGSYDIRPEIEEQVLPTEKTILKRDLVVQGIPYAEVSNISGGMTASIG